MILLLNHQLQKVEYNEVGIHELVTLTNLGPIIKEKLIFYKISNEKIKQKL